MNSCCTHLKWFAAVLTSLIIVADLTFMSVMRVRQLEQNLECLQFHRNVLSFPEVWLSSVTSKKRSQAKNTHALGGNQRLGCQNWNFIKRQLLSASCSAAIKDQTEAKYITFSFIDGESSLKFHRTTAEDTELIIFRWFRQMLFVELQLHHAKPAKSQIAKRLQYEPQDITKS